MKQEEYKLTIYESIAAYVLLEYQKRGGRRLDEETVNDDALLRKAITEASEWFEKTDAREINDSPYYPYVKRQFEEYLKTVRTDNFFLELSEGFRRCLLERTEPEGNRQYDENDDIND